MNNQAVGTNIPVSGGYAKCPDAMQQPMIYQDPYKAPPIKLREVPKPVGYWCIGGTQGVRFAVYERPTNKHIANHLEMLGWVWEDAT